MGTNISSYAWKTRTTLSLAISNSRDKLLEKERLGVTKASGKDVSTDIAGGSQMPQEGFRLTAVWSGEQMSTPCELD